LEWKPSAEAGVRVLPPDSGVAELNAFFITMGRPQAHDNSDQDDNLS
jgi:hypothetical protein